MKNLNFKVEYVRDGLTEEVHTGIIQFGSSETYLQPYFIRSCAKPLQASLLADYEIGFTQEELAFCSGSHAGEECHIKVAKQILKKLQLNENYLKCGIHPPLSKTMQDKMLLNNEKPSQIHNNCSGKHLGFLAICKKNNWDLNNYYIPEHPLQIEVKNKIYNLCELEGNFPTTTDGCGVPIVSMPLKHLVIGYKNLCKNYPKIVNAIINNPYIYGGEDRLDTEIITGTNDLIAKVGAGGLCVVYNIKHGEGFAVKVNSASMPARKIVVLNMINKLDWGKIEYDHNIKTLNGKIVGKIVFKYTD